MAMLYLSRHGETLQNLLKRETGSHWLPGWKDKQGIWDLTDDGRQQSLTLGKYVRDVMAGQGQLSPPDIIIITSTDRRSIETGEIVREAAGIPECNIHSYSALKERVPKDLAPPNPYKNPELQAWIDSLRPREELIAEFTQELERVIGDNPGKVMVAPLHSTIGRAFVGYHNGVDRRIGNCSITPLSYSGGRFTIAGRYLSNDDLRSELEKNVG